MREFGLLVIVIFLVSLIWLNILWSEGLLTPQDTLDAMFQDIENYGFLFLVVDFILFYFIWRWIKYWKRPRTPENIWHRPDDRLK